MEEDISQGKSSQGHCFNELLNKELYLVGTEDFLTVLRSESHPCLTAASSERLKVGAEHLPCVALPSQRQECFMPERKSASWLIALLQLCPFLTRDNQSQALKQRQTPILCRDDGKLTAVLPRTLPEPYLCPRVCPTGRRGSMGAELLQLLRSVLDRGDYLQPMLSARGNVLWKGDWLHCQMRRFGFLIQGLGLCFVVFSKNYPQSKASHPKLLPSFLGRCEKSLANNEFTRLSLVSCSQVASEHFVVFSDLLINQNLLSVSSSGLADCEWDNFD